MRVNAQDRRGSVLITVAAFMFVFIMIIAFAVDYGYLLVVRTDLQRAADAAALAAAQDLLPDSLGVQPTGAETAARATARTYANANVRDSQGTLTIPDADIEIGRFDRTTINSGTVTLHNTGMSDAVRVTIRRDGSTNTAVPLFFGRVFGLRQADIVVAATAVLRPVKVLVPGNEIIPLAIDINEWNAADPGDNFVMYADGRFEDGYGNTRAGNWGALDIGDAGNSNADLMDQITDGLRQSDLDDLASEIGPDGEPRIPDNTELPVPMWANGDTGLSAGMKNALAQVVGIPKLIPIVDQLAGGNGNNSEFHVVKWGYVRVTSYSLQGKNKYVSVEKMYAYDGSLKPNNDLSDTTDLIDGAYASAGLVE